MKLDLAEVLSELRDEGGWIADGDSDCLPHCWNLHRNEQAKALRTPDAYEGGPDLAIRCTQLELPASQQAATPRTSPA